MNKNILFLSAGELAQKIRKRALTAVEVVDAHLQQIARFNPELNAIITLDEAGARRRAGEADAALAKGEVWGPLHGVPVTIKDVYETAGLRTTSSFKPLANYIPQQDATVVARMRSAGAILLGKTNMPMLAMDFQTNSPLFGRANNPWNTKCTPGGSTGGGAAAVAAGLSPLEIGSDMGGSIRIPAHFCGLYALKPTEHRVSIAGHIPEPPGSPHGTRHMGVPGILARSIADLKIVLPVIAGPDGRRWEVPPVPVESPSPRPLKGYRIAWTDDFGGIPASGEIKAALKKLVGKLANKGCKIEKCQPPDFDFKDAWQTWGEIFGSELGATMPAIPRFLARTQFRLTGRGSLPIRAYIRGMKTNMPRYVKALCRRDDLLKGLEDFFSRWDAWLCPVCTTTAFTHRKTGKSFSIDGQKVDYFTANMAYTTVFSMTGSPVVVLPAGQSKEGLPIGVQLVGKRWQEMALLNAAEVINDVTGAFQHPPGFSNL